MTCYPTCPLQRAVIAGMQAEAALKQTPTLTGAVPRQQMVTQ